MEIEKNRDRKSVGLGICIIVLVSLLFYGCWEFMQERGAPHRISNVTEADALPPDATAIMMNPARDDFFEILAKKEGFRTVGHFLLFGQEYQNDLSGKSIAIIAKSCPDLYFISIENCNGITNEDLILLKDSKRLEIIHIHNCSGITKEVADSLPGIEVRFPEWD